jgi:hypothetical protein
LGCRTALRGGVGGITGRVTGREISGNQGWIVRRSKAGSRQALLAGEAQQPELALTDNSVTPVAPLRLPLARATLLRR